MNFRFIVYYHDKQSRETQLLREKGSSLFNFGVGTSICPDYGESAHMCICPIIWRPTSIGFHKNDNDKNRGHSLPLRSGAVAAFSQTTATMWHYLCVVHFIPEAERHMPFINLSTFQ